MSTVPPVASKNPAAPEQTEEMVAAHYCLLRDAGYSLAEALALASGIDAVSAQILPRARAGAEAALGDCSAAEQVAPPTGRGRS